MTIKEFEIQLALGSMTYDIKRRLSCDSNTSKEILRMIYNSSTCWELGHRMLVNPNIPEDIKRVLHKKLVVNVYKKCSKV